jgi:CTP synthase
VLRIGMVGKYVELEDAYLSVKEALYPRRAQCRLGCRHRVDQLRRTGKGRDLGAAATVDGIVVPGGFGYRGIEGKIRAARAREQKVPYLGLSWVCR